MADFFDNMSNWNISASRNLTEEDGVHIEKKVHITNREVSRLQYIEIRVKEEKHISSGAKTTVRIFQK